jgi:hypothetical protein
MVTVVLDFILGSLFVITLSAMLIAMTSAALWIPVALFAHARGMLRDSR